MSIVNNRYETSLTQVTKDANNCLHTAQGMDRICLLEEFDDWLFAESDEYEVMWLPKGGSMLNNQFQKKIMRQNKSI